MNTILEAIIKARQGHYCHAIEVETTYDIENIIESIAREFPNESEETLKDFFNTISIYYIENEVETEEEVYEFSTNDFITNYIPF